VEGKKQNDGGEWEQRKCKEKSETVKRKAPSLPGKGKCAVHFVRKHGNLEFKTRFTCTEVTSRKWAISTCEVVNRTNKINLRDRLKYVEESEKSVKFKIWRGE